MYEVDSFTLKNDFFAYFATLYEVLTL